ncbi:nuclear pore complex protein Nup153 [Protopterus annectens]|uniref:nuclear pore complex protein Nup153 n=1 Tax=Protopterus annectens TaxID=7888 RepID=UPI001CF983DD|nr:nuclear pore complex protein Nup153 [Protopterus annectens]
MVNVNISKPASVPSLWSPEDERSRSSFQHATTNLKKPAFNLSVFSSTSPSVENSSMLNSGHIGDSPFYPGKTTYGGAAAVKTSRVRTTPYQAPVRRQMKAKPASSAPCGVTSVTARRILMSLERMSSPLADAKRIPSASSPVSPGQDRSLLDDRGVGLHKKKVLTQYPPVQKLVTPKTVSVTANRSLYFKPSLSSSVSLNKRSKITERSVEKQVNSIPDESSLSTKNVSCPAFSTPAANGLTLGGAGGKIRRERNAHLSTKPSQEEQLVEVPDLPRVALPISAASLPSFSFGATPSSASSAPTFTKPVSEKVPVTDRVSSSPTFTFSSPIVLSTETVSPVKSADFKFCTPVGKIASSSAVTSKSSGFNFGVSRTVLASVSATSSIMTSVKDSASHLSTGGISFSKKKAVEFEGAVKPAKELKEGSVLDILKSPAFASPKLSTQPQSTLTCTTSVESCTLEMPKTTTSASSAFTDNFKPATVAWQSATRLKENSAVDRKCVKSQEYKPDLALASCGIQNIDTSHMKTAPQSSESLTGFGEMFIPPPGTWECDTCLILNKHNSVRCAACDMPKPGTGVKPALTLPVVSDSGQSLITPSDSSTLTTTVSLGTGFGDKFKKPEGYWDCSTCLVSNKPEDSKCVACQTAKQGGPVVGSVPTSVPNMCGGLLGFGDRFKKPEGSWNCETCLVQNKVDATQCVACGGTKPGTKGEAKGGPVVSSVPTSSSNVHEGLLGFGDKFKKPEGSWNCETCLVQNKVDATQCVACGGTKPDKKEEAKGPSSSVGTPFKFGVQPSSAETFQAVGSTGFKFGNQDGAKFGLGTTLDSSSSTFGSVGCFKFDKPAGGFKFGIDSPERKTEAADNQKESQSSRIVTSSLPSASALSAPNTGVQGVEEKNSSSLGNISFGTNISNNSTAEGKGIKGSLGFGGLVEKKDVAATPFVLAKPDEKTDGRRIFTLGQPDKKGEQGTATESVFRKLDEKQEPSTSVPFQFGKRKEMEEPKTQPEISLCKPEQSQGDAKPAFFDASKSFFNFGNSEKTAVTEQSKSLFSFGANATGQTAPKPAFSFVGSGATSTSATNTASTISNQTVSKPAFNFVGSASSSTCASNTASTTSSSSVFGTPISLSSRPASTFMFGQSNTADGSSSFGNATETTVTKPLMFGSQENKPQVGGNVGATVPSFGFGSGGSNTTATPTAFPFGAAATTATSTGSTVSTTSFAFVSGSNVQGNTPAFGSTQVPAFGQSSTQSSAPSFGSPSLFPAGSQAPAFGSLSGSSQPPVFGQQPNPQPAFGTAAASANSGGFQFPSINVSNFNFASANPSGVFQFGASTGGATAAAPSAQTAVTSASGFQFNPTPAFTIGKVPCSTSGRKIKTAVRRRK